MAKANDISGVAVRVLENGTTRVELTADFRGVQIGGDDKRDKFNEPRFFTTSKRGLVRAWVALCLAWTETMTLNEVERFIAAQGVRTHGYCAMD